MFQVSLAVEVFCFDISDALRKRTADHHHVAGEELILSDLNDAADLDVEASCVDEGTLTSGTAKHLLLVLFVILFAPFVVLVGVLDHRDGDNAAHGHKRGRRAVKVLQTGHQLQERHEEEIGVGHLAELLE